MSKIVLPESGVEVEVKSLSWDDAEEYLKREEEASGLPENRQLTRWTVETACPGLFDKIKDSSRDVNAVQIAIVRATFGDPEAEKNSSRSGEQGATQTA